MSIKCIIVEPVLCDMLSQGNVLADWYNALVIVDPVLGDILSQDNVLAIWCNTFDWAWRELVFIGESGGYHDLSRE